MDRTIQYFQGNRKIGKLEIPDNLTFSNIRDPGCRGSIRLVKTVCLNQFSDFIIIKNDPKSIFYIKFVEKLPKCSGTSINTFTVIEYRTWGTSATCQIPDRLTVGWPEILHELHALLLRRPGPPTARQTFSSLCQQSETELREKKMWPWDINYQFP